MANPNYSGFLSNFMSHTASSGTFTDILSTISPITSGTVGSSVYSARYFTMGDILIQFTDFVGPMGTFKTGQQTITFPKSFNGNPWCVVAMPAVSGSNNSGSLTIRTDPTYFTPSQFTVYFDSYNGAIGLTYIAIGPGPPI